MRRLREPRYLIGAIAGAAYFWFLIFRRASGAGNGKLLVLKTMSINPVIAGFASVVALVIMILAWALPGDSGGIEFSDAEIAFLFPAPLHRRDLILYKIFRAQPQALFSALVMTVLGWWRQGLFIGVYVTISVLSIYFMFVSLGRARLKLAGFGFLSRLIAVSAILAGLFWLARFEMHAVSFAGIKTGQDLFKLMKVPFETPLIVKIILFVPHLFASAAIPSSLTSLAVSCLAVIALGIAFFYMAVAMNVSFEEASIAASQRRTSRRDRSRSQRSGSFVMFRRAPPLFRLQEKGPAEVAFIWKNLIALMRNSIGWVGGFAMMITFMVGLALWFHESPVYT
ncbi:MAG: putative ABC exporter domain-containing protein, partial [Thermoanaerobaculia bacterium]